MVLLLDLSKRVNWIIKRVKFRFCDILKTWSIASLISMCDAELADDRNQVDARHAYFFQNTQCSILPLCSILPRLTMQWTANLVVIRRQGLAMLTQPGALVQSFVSKAFPQDFAFGIQLADQTPPSWEVWVVIVYLRQRCHDATFKPILALAFCNRMAIL